ncbi:hypothetical protein [Priestia koreensis]|uniref:Polysaccharide biosynthesis protein n=1 Tax=Priestia koreensis TaxID=284581 RepID=A0A0M0LH70_9BACI|nr:hypothetical protein [Priestia koreensis]KOO50430.1 hypothetical protein AMD01_01350 [Priestia koreensis]
MSTTKNLSRSTRNVIFNIFNSVIVKGVAIFVGFITIPAYITYFDNNLMLGVWFTILSVLSWILNFDLGIGNGLRNRLVTTLVENQEEKSKKYISSAYVFLTMMASALSVILCSISLVIPWNRVFNVTNTSIDPMALKLAITILMLSILLQFILRIISSILYALQLSFVPNLLSLITSIILLVFVITSNNYFEHKDIVALAIVYFLAVNVPLLVTTLLVFNTRLKSFRPSISFFEWEYAKDTFKVGSAFLGLQLEAMIINNTSIFLITWLLGSLYVVEYNIYIKVFSLVSTVFSLITVPIWSAVTRAQSQGNYVWIRKTIRVLQLVGITLSVGQLVFLPVMQFLFNMWLESNSIIVDYKVMILFSIDQSIIIWSGICASICNGLNELKLQFKLMTAGAILIVPLSIFLTNMFDGYSGVILAHIISLIPYCIGQTIWMEKYTRRNILLVNNEILLNK